jgi:tetratricopeptide (TPR) repeat protein
LSQTTREAVTPEEEKNGMNTVLGLALLAMGLPSADTVPLYDNLGDHHYEVTTSSAEAQAYFDQGLRLYYAFNHQEGVRAFREAQRLDPQCAMCWWGEALAWGPNINLPMDSAAGVAAYAAVQRALELHDHASPREWALIRALATRYEAVPGPARASLDSAYARAMADVVRRHPDDPEAAVLYAESLMDLRPWNYWTAERQPQPGMEEALSHLKRVIAGDEKHPGACHFYIHAVEAVHPDRAVPCAERLATLMPGAGHLVHMPGHIYIRVGRYMDAVKANQHAVHADETYIRDQNPAMGMYTAGYYPHNYDFLAFAEAMAGRSGQSMEAAEKLAALIPAEMLGAPGMGFLQHWSTRRLQMAIRFGEWAYILAAPEPDAGLPHARAMWHYARGRALAARGEPEAAAAELEALDALAGDPALEGLRMEFNESPAVLAIAREMLAGKVALARGDHEAAIERLTRAVKNEEALLYGEPPEWSIPARQDLGAALLAAGRPGEAERVYREDLDRFRGNPWSLRGLADALRAQGKDGEAAEVDARFEKASRHADVEIAGSAF